MKAADLREVGQGSGYSDLLLSYLKPEWRRSTLLLALLLCATGLQIINPQVVRYYIDTARAGGALDPLMLAGVTYLGIAVVTQAVSVLDTYVAENLGWIVTNRLRCDVAAHCLKLDMSFQNTHTPGEMIERIDGDVMTITNFFTRFVTVLLGNALLLIGILVVLFLVDWRVGLAFTAFVAFAATVFYLMRDIATPHWTTARQASAELYGFLEERLGGIEDVRANGGNEYAMLRLYEGQRKQMYAVRKATVLGATIGVAFYSFGGLLDGLTFGLGGPLSISGNISIGTVYLIFAYGGTLLMPLQQLMSQLLNLQQAGAGIARIRQLRDLRSSVQDGPGVALPSGAPRVEFEHVSFAYNEGEPVLHNLSFWLEPGRVLGLLGKTGSGKTTVTRLLLRFYDPTEGTVRLGGADLHEFRLADLGQQRGGVTQDVQLFHATVKNNLTFFDRGIRNERIVEVLEDLGLGVWYRSLSDGLDTRLAGGSELSAGQAQLLAFARVFLKDPKLVILDEATSRLDPATTRLIERAVDKLLKGRTTILIAHRLEIVGRADEIVILDHGRIQEYGARERLARDQDSRFYHLLHSGMDEVLG